MQAALSAVFGNFGLIFITVAMALFGLTTLLGNLYYVDNALAYIMKKIPGKTFMFCFRVIAATAIFLGAGMSMDMAWDFSDLLMGLMAIINIPVIVILHRVALDTLKDYQAQKAEGLDPVFRAADIGLKEKTDFWN